MFGFKSSSDDFFHGENFRIHRKIGHVELFGHLLHPYSTEVMQPLFDYLDNRAEKPNLLIMLDLALEDFNTSYSRRIIEMLTLLEDYQRDNKGIVKVNWFHKPNSPYKLQSEHEFEEGDDGTLAFTSIDLTALDWTVKSRNEWNTFYYPGLEGVNYQVYPYSGKIFIFGYMLTLNQPEGLSEVLKTAYKYRGKLEIYFMLFHFNESQASFIDDLLTNIKHNHANPVILWHYRNKATQAAGELFAKRVSIPFQFINMNP